MAGTALTEDEKLELLKVLPRDITYYHSSVTGKTHELLLKKIDMHILEIEDVLFHHNSAVMMPENPAGKSAEDGTTDSTPDSGEVAAPGQQLTTGIKALALAYKQFEFDPKVRMIIAGHTDTTGSARYNFDLSEKRAKNVLYLLMGEKEDWARVSADQHKIEDYQQIMKYFAAKKGWACDPEKIDDKWGDKTKNACREFFKQALPAIPGETELQREQRANALVARVESDGKKRWPEDAWEAVFDLYAEILCNVIGIEPANLKTYASDTLRFISDSDPFVACGESFPIDDSEKNNYRSQVNRRVELIFFDEDEFKAEDLCCPPSGTAVHKNTECPLWDKSYFFHLYIDPRDLYAVVYHLWFVYFDRVRNELMSVPEGLRIRAFENWTKEMPTESVFRDGIYHVKVQYDKPLDDPSRTSVHFEFETKDKWIFTSSKTADPRIETRSRSDVAALPANGRFNYYDLPELWSSRNYWTRYDNDMNRGEQFQKVFKDIKGLKPLGANSTAADNPLIFSLDDIVLLDTVTSTQDIKDMNHAWVMKNLSNKSRVKILKVDETNGFLKLYLTDDTKKSSARIPLSRNLITEDPAKLKLARIVFFRNGFYTIGDKRTRALPDWENNGFVLGARAAVRNDTDYHVSMEMAHRDNELGHTGDYDLHYFHHLYLDEEHPVSFTISYVSISFMIDSRTQPANPPSPASPVNPKPSKADMKKYVDEGVYNAMEHWNRKQYFLKEGAESTTSTIIRPLYFFDERETFEVPDPKPDGIDFDQRPTETNTTSNFHVLFNHAGVATARRNALGGKSKFLGMVCRDENGHWGPAYHWNIRTEGETYSLFKLNKSGYCDWGDIFTGVPVTEHGDSYGAHTFAHELGHATGQHDEYVKTDYQPDPNDSYRAHDFAQFFIAYSMPANFTSMMYQNGAPRLHHLWYQMHKINEEIKNVASALSTMLKDKSFVARLERGSWQMNYSRHVSADTATHRRVPRKLTEPMHSEKKHSLSASPPKTINLALHDVGNDESSIKYFHANQDTPPYAIQYQAVLVVRVLLSVQFSGTWSGNQRALRIFRIEQAWQSWGGHYRLTGGSKCIKNIYMHFLPGFSTDLNHADRNYRINFTRDPAPTSGQRIPNSSGTLTVGLDVTQDELVRYMLNTTASANWAVTLQFIKTWVDGKLGESFTLQNF